MARLLRKEIKDLKEKVGELEAELSEWQKVGDCILKFPCQKEIYQLLKHTNYFILMAEYRMQQTQKGMKEALDKILFGD